MSEPVVATAAVLASAGAQEPGITVIRRRSAWASFNSRELWAYRDLLLVLGVRDVKLRYRQTLLGVIWVVMQPLLAAAIFAVVFGRVARLSSGGVPYFLFAFAGFVAWNAFQSTMTRASFSLIHNAQLVSKVYFPRLLLPLSAGVSALVDFAVGFALLLVLLPLYGRHPTWAMLSAPVWLLLLLALAFGMGFLCAGVAVVYRDVEHALPVLMQFLLYASPVGYAVSAAPGALRTILWLNPISGLLDAFRWSTLGGGEVNWSSVVYASGAALVIFLAGAAGFTRLERDLADHI